MSILCHVSGVLARITITVDWGFVEELSVLKEPKRVALKIAVQGNGGSNTIQTRSTIFLQCTKQHHKANENVLLGNRIAIELILTYRFSYPLTAHAHDIMNPV